MPLIAPFVPASITPTVGGVAATAEKAKAALSGSESVTGTITAAERPATTALSAVSQPPGTIASAAQPTTTSLSGTMQPRGTIAAAEQKATAALSGGQDQPGSIAATPAKTAAALSGDVYPFGTIGATATKTAAAFTGTMQPTGTIGATASKVTASVTARTGFVTRDLATGYLMINNQRYRCAGNNWADLGLNEDANSYGGTVVTAPVAGRGSYPLHLSTHSEIDDYLTQCSAMNATLIRTFAAMTIGHPLSVQPTLGSFSSTNLEPLDYALQQCGPRGIRLVLTLVDNYEYFTGGKFDYCRLNGVTPNGTASQFYANTTVINSFKAHINFVLSHVNVYTGIAYKNDPTILCWESGNELNDATWTSTNVAWTEDIAAHTKAQGAQQLFMAGNAFSVIDTFGADSMPSVDIMTLHPYDNAPSNVNMTGNAAAAAKTFKKSFILGEWPVLGYGFPTDAFGNYGAAGWSIDSMMATLESPEADGDMLWSMFPSLEGHIAVFTVHSPGDNADMIARVTKLTAHAARMSSPIAPELLTDNMTGSNGALLSAHTADSGSTYKQTPGWGDGTIQTNRVWFGAESYLTSSGTPPTADYDVTANIRIISTVQNAQLFVLGRSVWAERSMYWITLLQFNGAYSVTLHRSINGSTIDLGSAGVFTGDLTGTDHALTLRMAGNKISVMWDGGTVIDPVLNNDVLITGHAGCGGLNSSSTTGIHIDSLTVAQYIQPPSLYPPVRRPNYGALVQL